MTIRPTEIIVNSCRVHLDVPDTDTTGLMASTELFLAEAVRLNEWRHDLTRHFMPTRELPVVAYQPVVDWNWGGVGTKWAASCKDEEHEVFTPFAPPPVPPSITPFEGMLDDDHGRE